MTTKENIIYNILKKIDFLEKNEVLIKNGIISMEYLYIKTYRQIKPKRLNDILKDNAKKITLKELDIIFFIT